MISLIVLGILPLAVGGELLITLNWPDSVAGRPNSFPGGPSSPRTVVHGKRGLYLETRAGFIDLVEMVNKSSWVCGDSCLYL